MYFGFKMPLTDSTTIPLSPEVKPESTTQLAMSVMSTIHIPPTSEVEVMGHVNGNISEYPHILEQLTHKRLPVRVARALVIPSSLGVPVRLMNPTSETKTPIYSIATMEAIHSVEINQVGDHTITLKNLPRSSSKYAMLSKLAYKQNRNITSKESDQLFNLLLSYADIFADNLTDVGRTHLTKHTIKTGAHAPIRQHHRRLPAAH